MIKDEILYASDGIVRRSRGTRCTAEEGRCRPEFGDETDVNRIVQRMTQGQLPEHRPGEYLDVSGFSGGLQAALDQVHAAEEAYRGLPPAVRQFYKDAFSFVCDFETAEGVARLREFGVIPPSDEELADAREAAAEDRAARRAAGRAEKARIEAAKKPPVEPKA